MQLAFIDIKEIDKLLFIECLNQNTAVGDGLPVPVILEQNHIA
jgi:hypothetical protein